MVPRSAWAAGGSGVTVPDRLIAITLEARAASMASANSSSRSARRWLYGSRVMVAD